MSQVMLSPFFMPALYLLMGVSLPIVGGVHITQEPAKWAYFMVLVAAIDATSFYQAIHRGAT